MAVDETRQGGGGKDAPKSKPFQQQQTQDTGGNAAPGGMNKNMGGSQTSPLFNMMSNMRQGMSPPREIEEYLGRIDGVLEASNIHFEKVTPLRPIRGAYAYVYGDAAIVLLFSDMFPMMTQSYEPYSTYIAEAAEGLRDKIGKTIQIKGAPVIVPQDYNRAENMGRYIIDMLYGAQLAEAQGMDVTQFTKGSRFIVNTDMNQVRSFMDQISPQTVLPRMDVGFVLRCMPSDSGSMGGMYGQQGRNNTEEMLQHAVPVLAVGGYTEFVYDNNTRMGQEKRFIPVFRITHISSRIPITGMIHLALALASDVFLGNNTRHWINQFTAFGKGKPNVGNLIYDPSETKGNVLWNVENLQQLITFLNTYATPPVMFLDVIEGMARLPDMHAFANKSLSEYVRQSASSFMKMPICEDTNQQPLIEPWFAEVTGHFGIGSSTRPDAAVYDSRHATYLDTVATKGALPQEAADTFLSYPSKEYNRLRTFEQFYGPMRPMHMTYSSLITKEYVGAVANAMIAHGFGVRNTAEPTTGVSMSRAVQSWATGPIGTMAASPTNNSPNMAWGSSIYG